jgi:hypothetical protein
MRLEAVNEVISRAKAIEHRSHHFQRTLDTQTEQLPGVIMINDGAAVPHLLGFIIEYIELAPLTLACIESSAHAAQIDTLFNPFLKTALDYFVHPCLILNQLAGLDGLMIRAYQCHRLIEELYENNKSLRNSKVCELETTQANLLVHCLIGEPFANEIDESALLTMSRLVNGPDYYNLDLARYIEHANTAEWQHVAERWRRLLPSHQIRFDFVSRHAG